MAMNDLEDAGIGFIGAGKAGVSLGAYFRSKGLDVVGYASRSSLSARTAAEITSSHAFENMADLAGRCGFIFITTPDDQIGNVWNELAHGPVQGKILCHTSGSVASDIFAGIGKYGAYGYSIHPMHAFSYRDGRTDGLEKACFAVEGDKQRFQDVHRFFSRLGNRIIAIDAKSKALYHLANVMVSNFVVSLIGIGCECFEACGADRESALDALMPLIAGNIENVRRQGLVRALTGPVERNDAGTILKHLKALPAGYEHIYKGLSLKLVELSEKKHPDRDYSELVKCLADPSAVRPASQPDGQSDSQSTDQPTGRNKMNPVNPAEERTDEI